MNFSNAPSSSVRPALRWDIFCRVIDNHGDLGVCWRLCADLASRGHLVRLWVDDSSALEWMAPNRSQHIQILDWPDSSASYNECANVVIEAFGCELPPFVEAQIAKSQPQTVTWINLEYLSAESYVERVHKLPSPVMSGPAKGCVKWFYYPGFTPSTGGLLRELDLLDRQKAFQPTPWLAKLGLPIRPQAKRISLFCYEPSALKQWIQCLVNSGDLHDLLVAPGRPQAAIEAILDDVARTDWRHGKSVSQGNLTIHPVPYLSQNDFDHLLWSCDLNMIRGEDSLVRAIWAGKPFVWNIYPQDDDAHHKKLEAFLNWLQAPSSLQEFHQLWNGMTSKGELIVDERTTEDWLTCVQTARSRLIEQPDLVTQLLQSVIPPL